MLATERERRLDGKRKTHLDPCHHIIGGGVASLQEAGRCMVDTLGVMHAGCILSCEEREKGGRRGEREGGQGKIRRWKERGGGERETSER